MVTSTLGMRTAIQKARACGIAYAGVLHSSHFGAAGYYANLAAREGMIGLAMSNVDPCVTVPGGSGKVMGTNPISFAVPAGEERPIFLDIATSAVAASKVLAAKFLGKSIPDTWLVDDDGVPTTDPSIYPEAGALLPMAGHKGYGLALLVEVLAAVVTGAAMTQEVACWLVDGPLPVNQGHAFIAVDIASIMPLEEFRARMDHLIRGIKESRKAKGSQRIYLPGEMEWEKRERALEHGMALPDDVMASLEGLAADTGADLSVMRRGTKQA
jgi:ureidoglycolate dehydrogenase (NAD+)